MNPISQQSAIDLTGDEREQREILRKVSLRLLPFLCVLLVCSCGLGRRYDLRSQSTP